MRVHHLKSWPEPFAALKSGAKPFEIRKDDRGYMVGDILHLREYEPNGEPFIAPLDRFTMGEPYPKGFLTGQYLWRKVTYKAPGGSWGLPVGLCVLGVVPCEEPKE